MIAHIRRLLDSLTLYFAQRSPAELGAFAWTVDAKANKPTRAEKLWSTLILPFLHERPLMLLEGTDYSALERFAVRVPSSDRSGALLDGFDIKAMITERLEFKDSREVPGLQLVDVVASALTRALNNTLGKDGWRDLGTLFIRRRNGTLHFATLRAERTGPVSEMVRKAPRIAEIVAEIESRARPMLTDATLTRLP
jgi:hypothetical protein